MSNFFGNLFGRREVSPVVRPDAAQVARINTVRKVATIRRQRVTAMTEVLGEGNVEVVDPRQTQEVSMPSLALGTANPKSLPSISYPSVRVYGLHSRSIRQKADQPEPPRAPLPWIDAEDQPSTPPEHHGTLCNWSPQRHAEHEDSFVGIGKYKHLRGTPIEVLAEKLWEELNGLHNLWYSGRVGDFLGHHPWILLYPELDAMIQVRVAERDRRAGRHRSTSLNFVNESGTRVQRGFTVLSGSFSGSSLAPSSASSSGSVLWMQPADATTPRPATRAPLPLARVSNLATAIRRQRRLVAMPPPTPAATAPTPSAAAATTTTRRVIFHLTPPSPPADIMLMPESGGSCAIVSDSEDDKAGPGPGLFEPTPPVSIRGRSGRR